MHGSHMYGHTPYTVCTVLRTYLRFNSCDTAHSDQLESRLATVDSSQEALLQLMSVNTLNTHSVTHAAHCTLQPQPVPRRRIPKAAWGGGLYSVAVALYTLGVRW